MIVNVRLYCPKHPEGQVFTTESDVEIALVQGWAPAPPGGKTAKTPSFNEKTTNLVEKPKKEAVFEEKPPSGLCACGCGKPTMKTWAPGHYAKHQKALRSKATWPSQELSKT